MPKVPLHHVQGSSALKRCAIITFGIHTRDLLCRYSMKSTRIVTWNDDLMLLPLYGTCGRNEVPGHRLYSSRLRMHNNRSDAVVVH